MDAMPWGGTLTMRDGGGEPHRRSKVRVSDTGSGMTPEECGRLFTPYYTTKQHGTGLGLAIVQAVVSDHHGTVRVESTEGRGSTFVIELPVEGEESQPAAGSGRSASAAPGTGQGESSSDGPDVKVVGV